MARLQRTAFATKRKGLIEITTGAACLTLLVSGGTKVAVFTIRSFIDSNKLPLYLANKLPLKILTDLFTKICGTIFYFRLTIL